MNIAALAQSSIGRKLMTGVTGLLLLGFVIGHLTGNFLLLVGPKAFNDYAYFLEHLFHGAGLIIAEIGLIVFFLSHAWSGFSVWQSKWKARSSGYQVPGDAGGVSRKSISSTTMLWTGIILLVFVCVHVAQFKFGLFDDPNVNRMVNVDGIVMRDLYGLVIDSFGNPLTAGFYIIVMTLLGTHLWHGAWSAFQSLGLANADYLPIIRKIGNVLAMILAVGFLFLPAYILIDNSSFQAKDEAYMDKYETTETSGDMTKHTVSGVTITTEEEGA